MAEPMKKRMAQNRLENSANRLIPIPPLSVVRLVSRHGERRFWKKNKGRVFRVGYYSRMDGLDCIWLVNDEGVYEQTTDHEFLYRYFDVVQFANHNILVRSQAPENSFDSTRRCIET